MIIKAFRGIRSGTQNGLLQTDSGCGSFFGDLSSAQVDTDNGQDQIFFKDQQECLYVYKLETKDHSQAGIICCSSVDDYINNTIKRHELTQLGTVDYLKNNLIESKVNKGPVMFSYSRVEEVDEIVNGLMVRTPEYDFHTEDSVRHMLWVIQDKVLIQRLIGLFKDIPDCYIIDGHHRSEAAAIVAGGAEQGNPSHSGREGYNYFLSAYFPDDQLKLYAFHRLVKDLNGLRDEDFLRQLEQYFIVEKSAEQYVPDQSHLFGMYLGKQWYSLQPREGCYNCDCPAESLGPAILSKLILANLLGVVDERNDQRIDYIADKMDLGTLAERVNEVEGQVAFTLCPVSLQQFKDVVHSGNMMPPKSTYFDPKPKSDLVFYGIDDQLPTNPLSGG